MNSIILRFLISIAENAKKTSNNTFVLKLLSFNILAQNLLETHSYLYLKHDKKILLWKKRRRLLLQEILESNAHVCTNFLLLFVGLLMFHG